MSDSFCADFHDYLLKILSIKLVKHLFLKGFMIDSDDLEVLFRKEGIERFTFESWNLAFENSLMFDTEIVQRDSVNTFTLSRIDFIKDESDYESMENFLLAISNSRISETLKTIKMIDSVLTPLQVQKIINSLGLCISTE